MRPHQRLSWALAGAASLVASVLVAVSLILAPGAVAGAVAGGTSSSGTSSTGTSVVGSGNSSTTPMSPTAASAGTDGWTPTTIPPGPKAKKSNPQENLAAVSCNSSGLCAAEGSYDEAGTGTVFQVGTLSDGTWTLVDAAAPQAWPASVVQLGPVSCDEAGLCVIIGSYVDIHRNTQLMAETYSGGTWTAHKLPSGGNDVSNIDMQAVSCSGLTTCVAVGSCCGGGHDQSVGFVETYGDDTWTASLAVLPANASTDSLVDDSDLSSVSCFGDGSCQAVGGYTDTDNSVQGLMDSLSGGVWSTEEAPLPSGVTIKDGALESVSCLASAWCEAVGYDDAPEPGHTSLALGETLADGTWTPATLPTGATSSLKERATSVSCAGVGACLAAGQLKHTGFVDVLSGAKWKLTAPQASSNGYSPVSCGSPGSCVVIGGQVHDGYEQQYIDTWSGGTWTSIEIPLPAGAATTIPNGVVDSLSCASSDACVGVGSYDTAEGQQEALIESNASI